MFKILIDTSVWLDVPKDFSSKVVLDVLEELIRKGEVTLIVPRVVINEFQRNRPRIIKECSQSLSAAVRRAREIVISLGDPQKRRATADEMSDISQRIQDLGDKAIEALGPDRRDAGERSGYRGHGRHQAPGGPAGAGGQGSVPPQPQQHR